MISLSSIKTILTHESMALGEKIEKLGPRTPLLLNTLKWLVLIKPELSVINAILYEMNTQTHEARDQTFSELVKARDARCVISGRYSYRAEVAHIFPFSKCEPHERYDINNGLLLDAGLHKLWDAGEIELVPLSPKTARFQVHPDSMANGPIDIPELLVPVDIPVSPQMTDYICKRRQGQTL